MSYKFPLKSKEACNTTTKTFHTTCNGRSYSLHTRSYCFCNLFCSITNLLSTFNNSFTYFGSSHIANSTTDKPTNCCTCWTKHSTHIAAPIAAPLPIATKPAAVDTVVCSSFSMPSFIVSSPVAILPSTLTSSIATYDILAIVPAGVPFGITLMISFSTPTLRAPTAAAFTPKSAPLTIAVHSSYRSALHHTFALL